MFSYSCSEEGIYGPSEELRPGTYATHVGRVFFNTYTLASVRVFASGVCFDREEQFRSSCGISPAMKMFI